MWGQIIGTLAMGVAGAVAGGVTTYLNNKDLAKAYRDYADAIREGAEKYSGEEADRRMNQAGRHFGNMMQRIDQNAAASQVESDRLPTTAAAMQGMNNVNENNSFNSGRDTGAENEAINLDALYNRETGQAQNALNQAQTNANINNAITQGVFNTVGGIADKWGKIKGFGNNSTNPRDRFLKNGTGERETPSDERIKESPLPEASVEDALRQIDSVQYKYKDGTGLDQDYHVGTTAQSVENTPLKDMVSERNGVKQLDKQKMLEAVLAGCAALQKEIDELR